MTSNSNVLTIGTWTIKERDTIPKKNIDSFQDDFKEHLQRILLNGANSPSNETAIERFSVNEMKKNGHHYYEFGPEPKTNRWLTSGRPFEAKGVLNRIKNRISKDHWITDNVAKYKKDSRYFIQETVRNALHEEQIEIYQYLCYLSENSTRK